MRLVGVDDPWIARELGGNGEAGMARGDEHVPEDAVPADGEAAVHGRDAVDPVERDALVPARALAQLRDVAEELVDGRPVAVEDAPHERTGSRRRAASRTASPGNEVGAQWPSLSERISRCRIAAARGPPGAGRVGLAAEDRDLVRPEARVAQGRVGDEAPEPGADDRDPR